jgi:hypothetical protein
MVGLPTTNRAKPTIYTVKPDLKGTSIQQLMVNQPYIQSNLYMVGLPRFAVQMYPLSQV